MSTLTPPDFLLIATTVGAGEGVQGSSPHPLALRTRPTRAKAWQRACGKEKPVGGSASPNRLTPRVKAPRQGYGGPL